MGLLRCSHETSAAALTPYIRDGRSDGPPEPTYSILVERNNNTQHTTHKIKKKPAAEKRPNTTHPTNTTRNEKRRIKNKKNKNKDNLHRRRRRDLDDLRDLSRRPQSIFFCFVLLSLPARRWSEGGVEWSDATQSSPLRMFRLTFFDLCNVWRSIISFHFTWNEVATRFAIGGPASSSSSSAGHWCRPAPLFFFFWFWSIRQWRWWTWSRSIRFDYIRRPGPPYWATYWTHTHNPVRLLFLVALFVADAERKHCRISSLPFSAKRQREREKERERTAGHGRSPAPSAETIVEPDCTTATSEDPQKKSVRQPPTKKNHHHHHHHHNQRWRWHENENEVKKGWSRIRKTKKKDKGRGK